MSDETKNEVWNFVSEPDLKPMKVTINVNDKKKTDCAKYILVSPYTLFGKQMIGQTGALIMDTNGNPIWFRPLKSIYTQNSDFRVQEYRGKPVLTTWEGTISGTQSASPNLPDGDPEPGAFYLIFDQHYNIIKKLKAKRGFTSDVHEFTITKRNTALFLGVKQVPGDLSEFGGPVDGYYDNYSIQEVDIKTNELLFFWDVLDHVNPGDSMISASSAVDSNNIWDCFHVNSVEVDPNNDNVLLVSMRNMWAIYAICKKTKRILWQLGNKKSDFSFGKNAQFSWQHHARFRGNNRISMFDDSCCASSTSPPQGQARGLVLNLDFKKKLATVHKTFYHNPALFVASQGNSQRLDNGNYFIGWGQDSYASEFERKGNTEVNPNNMIYDMEFPGSNLSYRAYKVNWKGLPCASPSIAVQLVDGGYGTNVFASWNGSTETTAWQVLAGKSCKKLSVIIDCHRRIGFETRIYTNSIGPYFQVNALNRHNKIIASSEIIHI